MRERGRFFVDSVTQRRIWVPKRKCFCRACGSREQLCIDHDRWTVRPVKNKKRHSPYRRRLLCLKCNLQKSHRRYVSYSDGTCWMPGMRLGQRVPKEAGHAAA